MASTGSGNQPIIPQNFLNTTTHPSLALTDPARDRDTARETARNTAINTGRDTSRDNEPLSISTSSTARFSDPFSRSPGQAGSSSFSKSPSSPTARRGSIGAGYIKSPPLIPPLPENQVLAGGLDDGTRRGSDAVIDGDDDGEIAPLSKRDRRMSREWDASQTPPSRFQKVEGSIFATPASRDGHVARNKVHGFKEKVKELTGIHKNKD
ncbi:hypothetical protein BJ508DRAFT_175612 [Ascobolus immersus RN42]|uniref:Uncharacterized protein n=1 Tax=Ascobolus immersus RN42 TaxID=1160509 RepID=A0A3N4HT31_ASCIM|nr:hypothetical protein BJ508DRAFT_175612 [Ascobolus immersus RN42]